MPETKPIEPSPEELAGQIERVKTKIEHGEIPTSLTDYNLLLKALKSLRASVAVEGEVAELVERLRVVLRQHRKEGFYLDVAAAANLITALAAENGKLKAERDEFRQSLNILADEYSELEAALDAREPYTKLVNQMRRKLATAEADRDAARARALELEDALRECASGFVLATGNLADGKIEKVSYDDVLKEFNRRQGVARSALSGTETTGV